MSTITDPILREKYRENYKLRCAETNKCRECSRQNDNPTSLQCLACTERHRVYQNARNARLRGAA